jgi:hypothetical protein
LLGWGGLKAFKVGGSGQFQRFEHDAWVASQPRPGDDGRAERTAGMAGTVPAVRQGRGP